MAHSKIGLSMLLACLVSVPLSVEAKGLGGVVGKAAIGRLLTREAARDAATPAVAAAHGHQLMRYTTRVQARADAKAGLESGRHLTGATEGKVPLSAQAAQKHYGIPVAPQVREVWSVPKGWPERLNKVWRGDRDAMEITSPKPLPPSRLVRVEKLPK